MLDNSIQDALLRLTQREGRAGKRSVDGTRADSVARLVSALPVIDASQDDRDCDCSQLVRAALALAEAPDQVAQDVIAVVSACRGYSERIAQAAALVAILVRATGQDRPARQEPEHVRVVGA